MLGAEESATRQSMAKENHVIIIVGVKRLGVSLFRIFVVGA